MTHVVKGVIRKLAIQPLNSISKVVDSALLRSTFSFVEQNASDQIQNLILGQDPAMICRLGTGELNSMIRYRSVISGKSRFNRENYSGLENIAGFFPITEDTISRFYRRMVEDVKLIDVLGSWQRAESVFKNELRNAKRCPLADLEPYYHARPWSLALQGKRVLIVHPFVETIRKQYAHRKDLFENPFVLPEFDLKTFKAVQSLGRSHDRGRFSDWFEALKCMEDGIAEIDFEVALIGCGAYGLPLAAHVKRLGKKAVHLGGATQILFGIIGKRWESIPEVSRFFNKNWVRPAEEDRPDNFKEIEGGSYW